MRCHEVMKSQVEYARPEDSLEAASRLMRDRGIGFLPVCDASFRVLGVITDRDVVVRACAEGVPMATQVQSLMTKELVTCRPEDSLQRAEELMATYRKSRIVVCDEHQKMVGVISLSDVAHHDWPGRSGRTLRSVTQREVATT